VVFDGVIMPATQTPSPEASTRITIQAVIQMSKGREPRTEHISAVIAIQAATEQLELLYASHMVSRACTLPCPEPRPFPADIHLWQRRQRARVARIGD
jgi:hypothetical protein